MGATVIDRRLQRVVDSYHGVPCTYVRPQDAPHRPGEVCGEIHLTCRGHTKNMGREGAGPRRGDPCGAYASPGALVCKKHGAGAKQVKEAAAERVESEKIEKAAAMVLKKLGRGDGREIREPSMALARLAGEIEQAKEAVAELVAELDDPMVATATGYDAHPHVKLYERMLGLYRGILVDMGKLDIGDRIAGVEELQAQLQYAATLAGLEDAGIDVTAEARRAIARRLEALDVGEAP